MMYPFCPPKCTVIANMSENQSPSAASPAEEEQVKTQVTDEQIKTRLREILKDADLEKTTGVLHRRFSCKHKTVLQIKTRFFFVL